ncbi:MAG: lipoate--protein ligase [Haloplasmataceae bacterium]|jgi:lipoate-protein ligase A|nr:lipoate--protein ligase [Haloplasmataceae bacterium]
MLTIINKSTNPRFNLALEEYVLKFLEIDEDFILLWQNGPSVIIGRNQNTIEEVNSSYVNEHNINVVRRISGGGAVYHDLGNLNYTFVTKNLKDNLNNYRKFTEPVIKILNELGVPAEFSGRNDITIEGKKFSGNAQSYFRNKMFHHGTILFNADLEAVSRVLNVKVDKIESKGIKSVRSRVTNVLPYLKEPTTIVAFQEKLLKSILGTDDISSKEYKLTESDLKKINGLKEVKYDGWDWNYGESPKFDLQKSKRYEGGNLDIRLIVEDGIIENIKIFGDFFGKEEVSKLEKLIEDNKFEEQSLRKVLSTIDVGDYFFKITLDDLINCIFY